MSLLERHVFICVNEREPGAARGCCGSKNGAAVRAEFKKQFAACRILSQVRANKSGCLDQCEDGVVVVIYPEQVWYGGVQVTDVEEIVKSHVLGGNVVTRLLIDKQPKQPPRLPVINPLV